MPFATLLLTLVVSGLLVVQGTQPPAGPSKRVDVEVKDPLKQAAALFDAGQNAHQSGDLQKAIEFYREALARNPSLWPAEFQRSVAHLSLGQLNEARGSIDRVIALLSEFADSEELRGISARAQIVSGEIALAQSNREQAETAFRSALERNPQAGQAHGGLAEILLAREKPAEAVTEATQAIANGDDRSSTWTVLGTAQSMAGKNEEALVSLSEAIKRNPRQIAALRLRAEINSARGTFPLAITDLRAALVLDDNPGARLDLAEVLTQARQFDEAIALFRSILTTEPGNAEARTGLAVALIDSGKGPEAIAQLESLVKQQPDRADLHAHLAELSLTSQPERALSEYAAAAKIEPREPRHQIGVASAMVRLRRFQDAVPILRQVLSQNLKDDVAYFAHTNLGTALFELDDFAGAAAEYVWILKRQQMRGDQKRAAITLYFIGICFDKLGDLEQAMRAYEQFLAIASTDNQLEIDKVKLRLPSLRRQLQETPAKRKRN